MRKVMSRLPGLLAVAVMVTLAASGVLVLRDGEDRTLTATFASTTSLYEGAQVKVLGVKVGTVESIEVKETEVEVEISYSRDVRLPDDVHALVVPPSIVGDRFVQLAPAWQDGNTRLADGAKLDRSRTAVPLELDDVFRGLNDLSSALGPQGADKDGALSRLIAASAASLDGNGRVVNETIVELAGALDTLAAGQGDIQATVTNTDNLARTLAGNDAQVATLVRNLALVGTQLNGQRDDIDRAARGLASALADVAAFTRQNKGALTTAVADVRAVTAVLAQHQADLAEISDLAPLGLTNLLNIYEPRNWDPTHPELTPPSGRTGSASLRAALFDDLDVQLAFTLQGLCAGLPAAQAAQLAGLCRSLGAGGGDVGGLLMNLLEQGTVPLAPVPGADSLAGLLGGAR
jgi:phospholipid/cholesterol/gamma-HCH transport system substrate-binding protein